MEKNWLIISWFHDDLMDGAYGKKIDEIHGTYEEACQRALEYVPHCSPVGVVGEVK